MTKRNKAGARVRRSGHFDEEGSRMFVSGLSQRFRFVVSFSIVLTCVSGFVFFALPALGG